MTRTIKVNVESRHTAFVSGYGSHDLLTELRGRRPQWSSVERAWVTTEKTAMDVVAVAEMRNWNIALTANTKTSSLVEDAWKRTGNRHETPDPGGMLW